MIIKTPIIVLHSTSEPYITRWVTRPALPIPTNTFTITNHHELPPPLAQLIQQETFTTITADTSLTETTLRIAAPHGTVWQQVTPHFRAVLHSLLSTTIPKFPTEQDIATFLDTEIGPYVRSHGGNITFDHLDHDTLYIRLVGSCQHCPAATSTIHNYVEHVITKQFTAIRKVEHAKS